MVQVGDKDTITLVGMPNVFVKQLNQNQIKTNLLEAIERKTGNQPETVKVEILGSEQEYRLILNEYNGSLLHLARGKCPGHPLRSDHLKDLIDKQLEDIEEQLEKIKRMETAEVLV